MERLPDMPPPKSAPRAEWREIEDTRTAEEKLTDVARETAVELGRLRGAVGDYLAAIDETSSRKAPRRANALERLRTVYGGGE